MGKIVKNNNKCCVDIIQLFWDRKNTKKDDYDKMEGVLNIVKKNQTRVWVHNSSSLLFTKLTLIYKTSCHL